EDDVRDLVGLDSQALESLIRPREIGDAEVLEKLLPIEARIDQDCPTAGVFQHPEGHREVDLPCRVGPLHEVSERTIPRWGETDCMSFIRGRFARAHRGAREHADSRDDQQGNRRVMTHGEFPLRNGPLVCCKGSELYGTAILSIVERTRTKSTRVTNSLAGGIRHYPSNVQIPSPVASATSAEI